MKSLCIAGITIALENENIDSLFKTRYLFSGFSHFACHSSEKYDLNLSIFPCDYIDVPKGELLMDENFMWLRKPSGCISIIPNISGKPSCLLEVNDTFDHAALYYLQNSGDSGYALAGSLIEILFRNKILLHRGIVIHASAIEYSGKGIMFSAPSGTGKSTQAELWQNYKNAAILNGDRPTIRLQVNQPFVFGTPWSGSEPVFKNSSAPLAAIAMLEQAKENSLQTLNRQQALQSILPRCFLPYHDGKLMEIALDTLERIIKTVPIFLLKCRPDSEAVELLCQSIN